ncbi:MAG: allantoinase PuuE [Rhizobiales bacterium]|nr:allantoinase PuuE [Hyphomicrobiales bacterium]
MTTDIRDYVGYGRFPPHPCWPGDARIALNFVLNYEEGSENAIPDGDSWSDSALTEIAVSPVPRGERDLAAESMFRYGSRVGCWRVMRLFAERGLPMTIFACAQALERNPEAASFIAASQHDVCCHGWRWIEHYKLDEEEERRHIQRAVASLTRTVGARPLGWYCRYGPSKNTRRLVVEEGGFLYDSDAYDDELPYLVSVAGREHLVVPYSLTHNDGKFADGTFATADDFFSFLRDGFDLLYLEGADRPRMMSVGLHARLIGHPARAMGLIRFLDHVQRHDRVWICRRADIARHWLATRPGL